MSLNGQNYRYNLRLMAQNMKEQALDAKAEQKSVDDSPITKAIPSIGMNALAALSDAGIRTVEQLLKADKEVLKKALNPVTLKQVKSYIKENGGGTQESVQGAGV
jgi:predicted Fe-Mo cluster-binding NifX family protein